MSTGGRRIAVLPALAALVAVILLGRSLGAQAVRPRIVDAAPEAAAPAPTAQPGAARPATPPSDPAPDAAPAASAAPAATAASEEQDAGRPPPDAGDGGAAAKAESPRAPNETWPWLTFLYVMVLTLFPLLLMGTDVVGAYFSARETRQELLARAGSLSAEEIKALSAQLAKPLPGVGGLARSTMAIVFLLILGIAVFHMLALTPDHTHDSLDKVLTLLTGAVTSIVGFYFGNKAVTDAREPPPAPKPPPPATDGTIVGVVPDNGPPGTTVTVVGTGFGTKPGNVSFDNVAAATASSWKDRAIVVEVPKTLAAGKKVRVTVNPADRSAIQSDEGAFTVS